MCREENTYNSTLHCYLLALRSWTNVQHTTLCPIIHHFCGTNWLCCNLDTSYQQDSDPCSPDLDAAFWEAS